MPYHTAVTAQFSPQDPPGWKFSVYPQGQCYFYHEEKVGIYHIDSVQLLDIDPLQLIIACYDTSISL